MEDKNVKEVRVIKVLGLTGSPKQYTLVKVEYLDDMSLHIVRIEKGHGQNGPIREGDVLTVIDCEIVY